MCIKSCKWGESDSSSHKIESCSTPSENKYILLTSCLWPLKSGLTKHRELGLPRDLNACGNPHYLYGTERQEKCLSEPILLALPSDADTGTTDRRSVHHCQRKPSHPKIAPSADTGWLGRGPILTNQQKLSSILKGFDQCERFRIIWAAFFFSIVNHMLLIALQYWSL